MKIMCTCMNYGGNGASGNLYIYEDKMVFRPSTLMKILLFWGDWKDFSINIKSITGCEKKMMGYLDFLTDDGNAFKLNVFKKDSIINAVEERRAALYRKEGKTVPPFVKIG